MCYNLGKGGIKMAELGNIFANANNNQQNQNTNQQNNIQGFDANNQTHLAIQKCAINIENSISEMSKLIGIPQTVQVLQATIINIQNRR